MKTAKKLGIFFTIIWAVSFVAFNITKSNVFIIPMILGNVCMFVLWIKDIVGIYRNLHKK